MPVKPIPEGFHSVTPHLTLQGAAQEIEFMQKALGAKELARHNGPGGTIMHALVQIGDSKIMLGDAGPGGSPMPCLMCMYVEDTDAYYNRALAAGAKTVRAPETMFYGDRTAGVTTATGMQWWFMTHVEDVSTEEMERRAKAQKK